LARSGHPGARFGAVAGERPATSAVHASTQRTKLTNATRRRDRLRRGPTYKTHATSTCWTPLTQSRPQPDSQKKWCSAASRVTSPQGCKAVHESAAAEKTCDKVEDLQWRMILSENRFPPRIKSGAGFFGIMR